MRSLRSPISAALRRGHVGRPRGRGRIVSLLFALGVIVLQLGSAAHLILVQHARCVHGEMVHEHDDHGDRAVGAQENGVSATAAPGDNTGPSHDEDHCDALAVTHRIPDAPAPVGAATLLTILSIAEIGAACEIRPIGLLDVAPKGSPPAV